MDSISDIQVDVNFMSHIKYCDSESLARTCDLREISYVRLGHDDWASISISKKLQVYENTVHDIFSERIYISKEGEKTL